MSLMGRWGHRFRSRRERARLEAEMREEMANHFELEVARQLGGLFFGVSPTDTLCITASAATLLLTSSFASLLPGRRAVAVQPVRALRV